MSAFTFEIEVDRVVLKCNGEFLNAASTFPKSTGTEVTRAKRVLAYWLQDQANRLAREYDL